jgi:alkylation response protein AidB-like acyl-CoA dehydrogenase
MDFTYDDEQKALREAVRGLVGKAYADFEQRRRTVAEDPGFDEKLWSRLAEMGVLGLPFSEDDGGVGAGPVEVGIVAQELGRVLAPEPFLTSVVLAGGLVAAAGSAEQRASVLGALAAGESVLAFAHNEPGSRWETTASAVTATSTDDGWTLSGVKEPVPHGARADVLVVSAVLPSGETGLFLVTPSDAGVTRDGYPTHDGGRAARITLADAPATPLGEGGGQANATIIERL